MVSRFFESVFCSAIKKHASIFSYDNQYVVLQCPVVMRVSGGLSFIFMTTVDEEDRFNVLCQERITEAFCKKNARARALNHVLVI